MAAQLARLPDAELEVMQALWSLGEYPAHTADIAARLNRDWKAPTLLKLLSRLEERIEALEWDPPVLEGECILPEGYGFMVKDIQYSAATRSYHVVLQVGKQYLGDVTGYQAQVTQLQGTIQEQAGTIQTQQDAIAEKESTIAQQAATIESQTATIASQAETIEEMEAAGTAETVKAELSAAYEEGVESNG